jgi:hypothetical protein
VKKSEMSAAAPAITKHQLEANLIESVGKIQDSGKKS